MNETLKQLQQLASISYDRRIKFTRMAKKHSENECNGVYWYDDEKDAYSTENGNNIEATLQGKIDRMCEGKQYDFISWHDDPRGYVVKINSEKLDDDSRAYCRDTFYMDWGSDFAIIKLKEQF